MTFKLRTLKKRAEFLRARNGRYFVAPGVILQAVNLTANDVSQDGGETQEPSEPAPRFGFTASKKLGNAVARNRIKRRLREAVRLIAPQMARPGFEYVLIGRKTTLKRPFRSLLQDLGTAFRKVHGEGKGRPGDGRLKRRGSTPKLASGGQGAEREEKHDDG